ncbi:PorP/SprF family type IX secretion system membrane protein [Marivirga arenosa]|uniref:PorP/SprF family type IX secretion system membrane protein n=1 Tax=Marivirga arenosa TaxID=3059076 RepID=A0AA51N4T9_9BACT|nr:PorP/SprF family type IX secretion system membrane protein [Marivirga sp. ABR2-2]WMN06137.1 PorP/SprF family type IX secretion system membrane protein [Marivirga sp. ABR2-2]
MIRAFILYSLLFLFVRQICAQELPVYNHFYTTPYLYNPAEAAMFPFRTASINHRQQWIGVEGAPMVTTLTFESPFQYKKFGLSGTLRNFNRGLLSTNDVLATYSYIVNLTKDTKLRFGISGGVTSNSLDFTQVSDLSDPSISNFLNNNLQPLANVGLKIESATGINFGASLPRLFNSRYNSIQNFERFDFSPFDEFLVMAYFKKPVDYKLVTRGTGRFKKRIKLEDVYAPLQFYAIYQYSQVVGQRIELMSTLSFDELFWLGASYRLNYGFAGMVGLNMQKFTFSYAYEPSTNIVNGIVNGSHEIQLKFNIGGKLEELRERPKLKSLSRTEERAPRFSSENVQYGGDEGQAQQTKYYVVVKEYKDFNSADKLVKQLKKENDIVADIFFNKGNGIYYVYIYETYSRRDAYKDKKIAEEVTKFKNVKVIVVDPE